MQLSKVPIRGTDLDMVIQGFRGGKAELDGNVVEFQPSVSVNFWPSGEDSPVFSGDLTPENAHIISEEIRKHAEFAATAADKGE